MKLLKNINDLENEFDGKKKYINIKLLKYIISNKKNIYYYFKINIIKNKYLEYYKYLFQYYYL